MEQLKTFFFDSYAFYEIIEGNPNYGPYMREIAIITTKLNLMELHYGLLLDHGSEIADQYLDGLSKFAVDFDNDSIKEANALRASLKKRNLSYADCLGYIIAKRRNIRFLTGDKQFEDMENVEFVK